MTVEQNRSIMFEEDGEGHTEIPPANEEMPIETPAGVEASPLDIWLERGGKLAPIVAAVIGLAYLAGYVIVNVYLNLKGIPPPNLITSRYLATGVLYLLTTALPLIPIVVGLRLSSELPDSLNKVQTLLAKVGIGLAGILTEIGVITAFANGTTGTMPWGQTNTNNPDRFWGVGILLVVNVLTWLVLFRVVQPYFNPDDSSSLKARRVMRWIGFTSAALLFTLGLILTLILFGEFAYPRVLAAYGGGASNQVQFKLDPGSASTRLLPMADEETTEPVALLDQNDASYMVWLPANKQVVVIPRDAVRGVTVDLGSTPSVLLPP